MPEDVATKEIPPTLPSRKRNALTTRAAHLVSINMKMPGKHHTPAQPD